MRTLLFTICLLALSSSCFAASIETYEEYRQRHNYEAYQSYQSNPNCINRGGDRFGDPAPYDTDRPGFSIPRYQSQKGLFE